MATINASTTIKVKKAVSSASVPKSKAKVSGATTAGSGIKPRGLAPPLKGTFVASSPLYQELSAATGSANNERWQSVLMGFFRSALGMESESATRAVPHAASTTRDRSAAAANVAQALWLLQSQGRLAFGLKTCGILNELQRILFPAGVDAVLSGGSTVANTTTSSSLTPVIASLPGSTDASVVDDTVLTGGGLKASASAVSLLSLDVQSNLSVESATDHLLDFEDAATNATGESYRLGRKTVPPAAREGALLVLRALAQVFSQEPAPLEPYISGAFVLTSWQECASSNTAVRQAAEDTSVALMSLVHPYLVPSVILPLLLTTLQQAMDWRTKATTLTCLELLAQGGGGSNAARATQIQQVIYLSIPTLVPALTNQVWDTKPQVSKGARQALLAVCATNRNPDVARAIPAVCQAICKPADTNAAISELMGTTFIVPVDASTLAILCPVLARALKERLALHKRAACLVISNMSKLVDRPAAVAPFGSLLVPELQKVVTNVQFEEIRDEALKALQNLTKALGDYYNGVDDTVATAPTSRNDADAQAAAAAAQQLAMAEEEKRVRVEQDRIQAERAALAAEEARLAAAEAEERAKFKIAMDAARELEKIEAEKLAAQKKEEELKREKLKLSTKTAAGKCQGCGMKKCLKSCVFYGK
jgi:hypothetical protein